VRAGREEGGVARYLTQEWLDECRGLAATLPERPGATARIQYVIRSAEPGRPDTVYHIVFEDGRIVSSALGVLDDPDVVLTMSHADSVGVQNGELDANALFSTGSIGFSGDMRMLMSLLPILWPSPTRRLGSARVYRAYQQDVRARTEY
jgi:hypothetical protein